jgi:hypothetical protein
LTQERKTSSATSAIVVNGKPCHGFPVSAISTQRQRMRRAWFRNFRFLTPRPPRSLGVHTLS